MPVTFALISVLASQRDFGHISRLRYSEPLQAGATIWLNRPKLYLAPNNLIQVAFQR